MNDLNEGNKIHVLGSASIDQLTFGKSTWPSGHNLKLLKRVRPNLTSAIARKVYHDSANSRHIAQLFAMDFQTTR
jgi:hypothetical protein